MLVIRLFRVGKKNQPSFKIVVTDKRRPPKGGRFLEQVGFYNPLTKEKILKEERIKYWISVGAKPSATVYNLFVSAKTIEGKKVPKHKKSKKKAAPKEGEPRPEDSGREEKKEESAAPVEKKTPEATEKENSKQDSVVTEEKKEKGV